MQSHPHIVGLELLVLGLLHQPRKFRTFCEYSRPLEAEIGMGHAQGPCDTALGRIH